MGSRSTAVLARTTRVVCALCVLVLAVAASGCGGGLFGMDTPKDDMVVTSADAIRLEGKWTWPSLRVDYTEDLKNPRIYPTERVGEGWTFTIVKKGSGYTTVSGGTVTLKGAIVTITEESGSGDSITLTGEVEGDTIVGTVHHSVTAKTLSSGVAQGSGEYDGSWTATRVK